MATILPTPAGFARRLVFVALILVPSFALAQPGVFAPGSSATPRGPSTGAVRGDQPGEGGGANADFESLIDLIQSTVATETWAETGGGEADIRPFTGGGVLVDPHGTLRLIRRQTPATDLGLPRTDRRPADATDPRQPSAMRYVSLPRLEREIARRQDAGESLDQSMLALAGLRRVRYVLLFPETGDLVLAGPAGDWRVSPDGRLVAADDGFPVVRLDDLLVLWRRAHTSPQGYFGCSITPHQDALAETQAFLDQSSQQPLRPSDRESWLAALREKLGQQDIQVFGITPTSRVARVLVAADYHMKLIGMGLEEGVVGVESYLDSIEVAPGEAPPPMSVLRWWFTMHYRTIRQTEAADAFELVGTGARVESENELLTQQGQRVHTGQADELTQQFAHSFTTHFTALSQKYPVYAELRNVFDLALAVALIDAEHLGRRVGWQPSLLVDGERLRLPEHAVPRQVDTVVNHRVINRRHVVAGISGGVLVAPQDVLEQPRETEHYGRLTDERRRAPENLAETAWWWDAF